MMIYGLIGLQIIALTFLFYTLLNNRQINKLQQKIAGEKDKQTNQTLIFLCVVVTILDIIIGIKLKLEPYKIVFLILATIVTVYAVKKTYEEYKLNTLSLVYSDIFFTFEIGYKANMETDQILNLLSNYTEGKVSTVLKQAAAIYRKGSSLTETMDYLYANIKTTEIAMLRSAVIQFDRIGHQGIRSMETLTEIATNKKITYLIKKREMLQYATVFAAFLALVGMFAIMVFPMLNITNESLKYL